MWFRCPPRSEARRGSILIPVMMIMLLLAYLGLQVGREIAVDYAGSAYLRTSLEAGPALDYGRTVALTLLAEDLKASKTSDNLREEWANPDSAFETATENLDQGELSGVITDEQGLLPINMMRLGGAKDTKAAKAYQVIFLRLMDQLLSHYGVDGDPKKLLDSILLWLGDDKGSLDDDSFYAAQEPPYTRGNDDFHSPEELALVRFDGVSREDWARLLRGEDGTPGLLDFVSVWSEGPINMNTAPEPIVRAVAGGGDKGEDYWQDVRQYRADESNGLGGSWYVNVALASGLQADNFPTKALTSASSMFRIALTYSTGSAVIHSLSVVRRDEEDAVPLFNVQY